MHKVPCYPPAHLCLVVTFSTICAVSVGWETLYNLWDDRNMWDYSMNWQLPSGLVWSQSQTQLSGLRLLILLCSYQSLWVLNSLNLRQPVSRTEDCAHQRFVLWSVPTSVVISWRTPFGVKTLQKFDEVLFPWRSIAHKYLHSYTKASGFSWQQHCVSNQRKELATEWDVFMFTASNHRLTRHRKRYHAKSIAQLLRLNYDWTKPCMQTCWSGISHT